MSNRIKKERPAGVPEENVYNSIHWTLIVALIATAGAVYLAVTAAG